MTRTLLLYVYPDIVRAFGAVRTGMLLFVIFVLAKWLSTKSVVASSVAQQIKRMVTTSRLVRVILAQGPF